eukprot:108528-Chlamydomonas_euryale.AAC.2
MHAHTRAHAHAHTRTRTHTHAQTHTRGTQAARTIAAAPCRSLLRGAAGPRAAAAAAAALLALSSTVRTVSRSCSSALQPRKQAVDRKQCMGVWPVCMRGVWPVCMRGV